MIPENNNLILQPLEARYSDCLIVSKPKTELTTQCKVLSVGEKVTIDVKPGDVVLVHVNEGTEIDKLTVIHERHVIAKVIE